MVALTSFMLAALSVVVAGAKPCGSSSANSGNSSTTSAPTLPSTGGSNLPDPPANATLKYIALGHGLQNYTCANNSVNTTAVATGALAVLYDITSFYPGTPKTGLSSDYFNALTTSILWSQDIPVHLVNSTSAIAPGTSNENSTTNVPEADYQAVVADPFPSDPPALVISQKKNETAPFLGVHYFDDAGRPTFDLSQSPDHLRFSGAKNASVSAPTDANKGLLQTGAVAWLQLIDNGKGLSSGLSYVYRVVTEGGAAEPCSESGAGTGSVPYTAQYWFYA